MWTSRYALILPTRKDVPVAAIIRHILATTCHAVVAVVAHVPWHFTCDKTPNEGRELVSQRHRVIVFAQPWAISGPTQRWSLASISRWSAIGFEMRGAPAAGLDGPWKYIRPLYETPRHRLSGGNYLCLLAMRA